MKVLVAVPIFNEQKYVARVLREIRKYARASAAGDPGLTTRVLVLDDGSTDRTAAILAPLAARGHIDLITHPENRGYGQSLIDAFHFAAAHDYDWVITMDCDEQHEPCRIPAFIAACQKDDADIISGSRYMVRDESGDLPPVDRRSINQVMTDMLNSVLNLEIVGRGVQSDAGEKPGLTDSFCGFKAHRVSAMQKLRLTIPGYAFPMQFWVQAAFAGLKIEELPVRLIYKDATRHFGGNLDDPTARLSHYLEVLTTELATARQTKVTAGAVPDDWAECELCCEE